MEIEEIPQTYDLETIEQLRAVADPLRVRIVEALSLRPMTATQVGEELEEPAPKAHYHVRELERVGLVKLVETRERGGILEKYYRAVARTLRVPPTVLQMAPPDEVAQTMDIFVHSITSGFQSAVSRLIASGATNFDDSTLTLSGASLWMTPDEYRETLKQATDLFKPYNARRGVENEREITMTVISYDALLARHDPSATPAAPRLPLAPRPPTPSTPPAAHSGASHEVKVNIEASTSAKRNPIRKMVVAGAVNISRRELEELAKRGEQYDLTVFGYLSFASDVTADLVRRTVARVSYRGVLAAPDEVRAALKAIEKEK